MLDLQKISDIAATSEAGSWLDVLDPITNLPSGIRILLAGTDSHSYRKKQREISNRRLNIMAQKGRRYKLTAEEVEAEGIDLLASCVIDWEGIVDGGEKVPCNFANAQKIFERIPWIKEQVDDFIGDRAHFLPILSNDSPKPSGKKQS